MPDPVSFPSHTPRLALPLLFAGQAQKEVTVNEALTLADFLLHTAVEDVAGSPPATPAVGQAWLVAAASTGAWAGHEGDVACWSDGGWRFITPSNGMRIYSRSAGAFLLYGSSWQSFHKPADPVGGSVIDAEARAAISAMIALLASAGVMTA